MRPVTLRNGLVLIVIAALLPIGTLSVIQALGALRYSRTLIGNALITNALATAARERDPLIISKQVLRTLSQDEVVKAAGAGCAERLKSGLGSSPALLNLARSDAQGRVLCSITEFDPATSFARQAWWQKGIRAQGFSVSAPVFGPIAKTRILVGMQPVISPSGANDGAVTVAIDASWLERSLADSEMSRDAAVAIVDSHGSVVLTNETRSLPRFDIKAGQAKVAEAVTEDHVHWMYSVAPLYDRALFVVYAEPAEQLMATALNQVRVNLLLPFAALLLACLAIWLGASHLVLRWLESLRALAGQFARGNFVGEPAKFEHAPRELALLGADLHRMAQAIETRDHALQAALDAKTALTHDIHHRVKNNLQIVSSLISLQASKITDPAAREALSQTRARIGALAQIHRLLYEESHEGDHGTVKIASLFTALCAQLRNLHREHGAVILSCKTALQTVPIDHAVPLTLLLVEAITNAYRHGFAVGEGGTIMVHFDQAGDQATLMVQDDGAGFLRGPGTASMGQQLMEAFAQQLGGVLKVTSEPSQGTCVILTYPMIRDGESPPLASAI